MEKFRLFITGSREASDRERIKRTLSIVFRRFQKDVVLISGTARGADSICESIAEEFGWEIERHPADWNKYGKRAGYLRNTEMVDSNPDFALAFFVGDTPTRGTQLSIDLCRKKNVKIKLISNC